MFNAEPRHFRLLLLITAASYLATDVAVWSQSLPTGGRGQATPVKKQERLTMTVELDSKEIAALRVKGLLRTNVPAAYRNRLDAIEIKRSTSFKAEHFVLHDAVDKVQDSLTLTISEASLDRLEYQPIKAKIYYSQASSVVLVLDRQKGKRSGGVAEKLSRPTANDSPKLFVRIDDRRGLSGWMSGLAKIDMTAGFGSLSVNTNKIAGIRFNADAAGNAVVQLKSGQSLVGRPSFDSILMKCSWGIQKLAVSEIESVTVNREARFVKVTGSQGQWRFDSGAIGIATPETDYEQLLELNLTNQID